MVLWRTTAPALALAPALTLALALAGCAEQVPQMTDDQIEEQVRERFATLAAAAQSLDHDAYFAHFDDTQFTAMNANGTITTDFAAFRADYLKGVDALAAYRKLDFANVRVEPIDGATVILVNEYEAEVDLTSGAETSFSGAGTQVWRLDDDQWKIVHVSSSMKQP